MREFALRAAGMYFLALLMIRLLGKRALGELGPFDFVIMSGVGNTVISVTREEIFACPAPIEDDDKPKIKDRLQKIEEQLQQINILLQGQATPEL